MDQAFWIMIGTAVAPYAISLVMFIGSIFAYKYLVANPKDINSVQFALRMAKMALAGKLGGKASAVFDIWLSGLESIKDGDFTSAEAVDQFVSHLLFACKQQGIELSTEDVQVVRSIAETMFSALNVKSKSTTKALQMMRAEIENEDK